MELMGTLYELGFVVTILTLFAAAEFLTIWTDEWLEKTRRDHGKKLLKPQPEHSRLALASRDPSQAVSTLLENFGGTRMY
jgi:hypothetical protein